MYAGEARAAEIFAFGDIFHFRGDDAFAGIVHLADTFMPGLARSTCLADIGEGRNAAAAVGAELAIIFGADFALEHLLDIAAFADPAGADFGEAGR